MKISIVGMGHVGTTLAYALVLQGLAGDLVLVSRDQKRARGEALDLSHALSFSHARGRVRSGTWSDAQGSDIVVVTASVPFVPPMKGRGDLAHGNRPLMDEIAANLQRWCPSAVVLVVTNPVDAMTHRLLRKTGFEPHRVMGIGTLVDSARFRTELSEQMGVHPSDLRAYVLGEHGPTQFAALSAASVGGELLTDHHLAQELLRHQMDSAFQVMESKGYTNFAISSATALVIESIVHDQRRTMPLSVLADPSLDLGDVCLSWPCVVGRGGIERVLKPRLDHEELVRLRRSAEEVLRQTTE